jgi:iron complex outermembrane receptor protein
MSLLGSTLSPLAHAQTHEAPDEIIVTGVPRDRAVADLAQPVAVLGGDQLDRARAGNLGETLAGQLGVSSSYFGAGASRPIIRGLAGARVQTLEDGLSAADAATVSDDHAVTIEPLAADQVEIFRGPMTLLYGSGAVGGVVNTVTTRVPGAAPRDGLEGAFELRTDTVAEARGAAFRLDGGADALAWHFDAGRRDSRDYEIPAFAHADVDPADSDARAAYGVVPNSAAESDSAAFGASWLGQSGFLGVGISAFDALYGIPGHEHEHADAGESAAPEAEGEAGGVRIDLEQRRIDLRGGWDGLRGLIEGVNVRLGVSEYEHVELEADAFGTRFTNESTELRIELLHRAAGLWSGAFGLQLGDREFAALGAEAFVPPVATSAAGVFVVEHVALPAWELSLGARVDSLEHSPSNGLRRFDERSVSYAFGAVRPLAAGASFVATLAQSERLPVAEELYSDGPHLATGVVQLGDASLRAETAQHVDLGLRGRGDGLDWSVTTFYTQFDDFIYLADTGAVDPVAELSIFQYRQAGANFAGLEAEVFVPLLRDGATEVDVRLFADYVRGELATGEPLPRLPPLRYGARLEFHGERLLVGIEGTRYDDQRDVAPFEDATPGYLLLNADARWQLAAISGMELELFATASNMWDEDARKHTSFVKDVAPLPGRNYTFGVRARF